MKHKEIDFDPEALVGSVESLAEHVRGGHKLSLRSHALTLPQTVEPRQRV